MTEELAVSLDGRLGRLVLDRPQAINALSLGMIEGILAALEGWRDDPAIGAVLVEGNGGKGFCAGGDVRAARAHVTQGHAELADAYFATEYRMNRLIAAYPKPLVSITHGVVMGGGIGISGHCAFRLTQPGARYAMPESAIGFFADVGVNAILAQAPLHRALLFLLSGVSVGATDAVALGLADAIVAPERLGAIRAGLAAAAGSVHPADAVGRLVAAEAIVGDEGGFCARVDALAGASFGTPAHFLEAVRAAEGLADIAHLLEGRCPGSLVATFHAQLRARRLMDVGATLDGDLRLAAVMVRRPDFAEGVRAVLVDKDLEPKWSPSRLAGIEGTADAAAILAALAQP